MSRDYLLSIYRLKPLSAGLLAAMFLAFSLPCLGGETGPEAAFEYFKEVALNIEYTSSRQGVVRKWTGRVGVEVRGEPTALDLETLDAILGELHGLVGEELTLSRVESAGDIRITFGPMSTFPSIEANYVPGNTGFVWLYWRNDVIFHANVLVDSSLTTQSQRDHYIREELTQALGLLGDSMSYPDSMFYQAYSETHSYSAMDRAVIRMLYDPAVRPGMDASQVARALNLPVPGQ